MTGEAAKIHRSIRRLLAKWYRVHQRELPWRPRKDRPADPYHVFVSEAMLQQTQVTTVVPYFLRFVEAFPTVEALAAADEQAVLRLWQGLGYYRRAKNLHVAAKAIVSQHAGRVPATVAALLQLPGVGRYTAGAIASIAYDVPAPIVDGNVARVLARVFAIEEAIDQPATRHQLWDLASRLVPVAHPGDFNQAMMELGATVCRPRQPLCLTCPLRTSCQALRKGIVERLPLTSVKRQPKAVEHHIVAVRCKDRYLFVQRPATGLWAGMWQLPTREAPGSASVTDSDWLKDCYGLIVRSLTRRGTFSHQLTHRTVSFTLWTGSVQRAARGHTWRSLDNLDDLPLANPQRRAVAMLHG